MQQIMERELERQRQQEILEREKVQLRLNIEQKKQADLDEQHLKEQRVHALMQEMEASNKIGMQKRLDRQEEEKRQEAEIIAF